MANNKSDRANNNTVFGYAISSIELTDKQQETFMAIFNDVTAVN